MTANVYWGLYRRLQNALSYQWIGEHTVFRIIVCEMLSTRVHICPGGTSHHSCQEIIYKKSAV